jgi:excisionase family DNA binding protein
MSKPPTDWISISEAADLLAASNVHFTTDTIGRWARNGQLQSIKLGNRRFVRKAQVRSLLRPHGTVHGEDLQPGLFEDLDD